MDFTKLWSTGVELTSQDTLECAMFCLNDQRGCRSFSYDQQTKICTLGHCVIPWHISTSPSVQMYQVEQPMCSSSAGFQVYTYGNISACLWKSPSQNNFTGATARCSVNEFRHCLHQLRLKEICPSDISS
nr:C-type lectin domain family 4 member E-like [Biomphalaria glabrata]